MEIFFQTLMNSQKKGLELKKIQLFFFATAELTCQKVQILPPDSVQEKLKQDNKLKKEEAAVKLKITLTEVRLMSTDFTDVTPLSRFKKHE